MPEGWSLAIPAAVVFLVVGSFLNVVVHRLPRMLERQWGDEARELLHIEAPSRPPFDLLRPGSRCPACEHPIAPWQNIPVVSWIVLRGRCHYCGGRIAVRYPVVEALSAVLGLVVLDAWGLQWITVGWLLFTWSLLALACIDFDTHLLPDQITLPLLWGGLVAAALFGHMTPVDAIAGAVLGYGVLWALYWAFRWSTGREGMGHGDFKLLAAVGAWLGWQSVPAVVLIASMLGLAWAAGAILAKAMRRQDPMPFGPFLAAGGWVGLMFREELTLFHWAGRSLFHG